MSTWSLTFQQRVLSDSRVTNISKSFTYKMAAKPTWHRHRTKLCHCHPMCSPLPARPSVCLFVFVCHKSGVRNSWVNWASFGWAGFGMGDSFHLSTLCRQEIRVSPKLCPKLWTLKISPWKVDLVINKTYLYGRACWRHLRLSTHHGCLLTRRSAVIPYTSICCATCSCCYEAVDNSSTRGDFSTDMTSRGQSSVAELIVLLVGTLWAPVSTVVVWRCDDVLTVCVCVNGRRAWERAEEDVRQVGQLAPDACQLQHPGPVRRPARRQDAHQAPRSAVRRTTGTVMFLLLLLMMMMIDR